MVEALRAIAPGRPLRDGLDRVLSAGKGALVVVGDGPDVLAICSGGFLLDAEFSPMRLSELAKMDGAIILAADASRIARANVHLVPNPNVPTSETGTRHRTADRVARSLDVPVIAVSEALSTITMYRGDQKHPLEPVSRLVARANQALQTLERYRARLDVVTSALSALEVEDLVTVRDVALVFQRAEMVRRIAREVEDNIIELGNDGRLVRLQLEELMAGVDEDYQDLIRDYAPAGLLLRAPGSGSPPAGELRALGAAPVMDAPATGDRRSSNVRAEGEGIDVTRTLESMSTAELVDLKTVAELVGLTAEEPDLDAGLQPRGYRLMAKVPRLSRRVVDSVVGHFQNLQKILAATIEELEEADGVGAVNARMVKEGLARMAETSILER